MKIKFSHFLLQRWHFLIMSDSWRWIPATPQESSGGPGERFMMIMMSPQEAPPAPEEGLMRRGLCQKKLCQHTLHSHHSQNGLFEEKSNQTRIGNRKVSFTYTSKELEIINKVQI